MRRRKREGENVSVGVSRGRGKDEGMERIVSEGKEGRTGIRMRRGKGMKEVKGR